MIGIATKNSILLVDYAEMAEHEHGMSRFEAVVDACRKRFPKIEFRHCDATNMTEFADAEFDAVVFSFNGIDCNCIELQTCKCKCFPRESTRVCP
ncbi:MAG: methyltransferase domain-containing protein [Phyllobacteriaceae bacterium]|nr:methyltransferase domain-containing protein [Phyllobacteriaceae bacterium]